MLKMAKNNNTLKNRNVFTFSKYNLTPYLQHNTYARPMHVYKVMIIGTWLLAFLELSEAYTLKTLDVEDLSNFCSIIDDFNHIKIEMTMIHLPG